MSTIRWSITRSLGFAVTLVCAVTFMAIFLFMRSRMIQQFDLSLRTTAETIGALIQVEGDKLELDERDDAMTEFRRVVRPGYFEVRDESSRTILRSASLVSPLPVPATHPGIVTPLRLPDGRAGRVICLNILPRVESDDEHAPATRARTLPVFVYVARESADLDLTLRWMAWSLAAALGVILAMLAVFTPALVIRGLRPLKQLSERASRLDAGNLAERFPIDSAPEELIPIGQHLNESLDRLAKAFARERRFAADAAHELRTPLAAIRANAEVAGRWPEPEQVQSSLADIARSSDRMQTLLDRLLEMARAGSAAVSGERQRINLPAFVRERIEQLGGNRRKLVLNMPENVDCTARRDFLAPLLDNLLVNAVTHSPEDSTVSVSVIAGKRVELRIANSAPHLDGSDLARMFDPLWTKSADRTSGHAGLGLALVSEYARLTGVTVAPELDSGGILTMTVMFP